MSECVRWAGLWRDKEREYILFEDRLPMLFRTRAEARAWIESKYGYIRTREDLKRAPHWWRVPTAVRVSVERVR